MKSVLSIVLNNFVNDSRVLKENISLSNNNYSPVIVALHDKGLQEKEIVAKVQVNRIKLKTKEWSKNKFIQIIKYFEFLSKVFFRYRGYDIIHCNDLNALPIGVLLKLNTFGRTKLIYDAHEHETERNGLNYISRVYLKLIERFLLIFVDKVITVSDGIAEEYKKIYKIEKPAVVLNAPYYQSPGINSKFNDMFEINKEELIFIFQGALSKGRGIDQILEAFCDESLAKCHIVFMGYGELTPLIKEASSNNINIHFCPAVSLENIITYSSSAHYGISGMVFEDSCLSYYLSLPNKMFEYLMAGLPILVPNAVEMKAFVLAHEVGVVVKDKSPQALIAAVKEIITSKPFDSAIQNVKEKFCWESQEKILLSLYAEL